ncbi:MAG: hypothetical protein IEMM0008_1113 [bacterium]|nr:MAG: hypothetical protein IEMM0008_1113 [bacterium]
MVFGRIQAFFSGDSASTNVEDETDEKTWQEYFEQVVECRALEEYESAVEMGINLLEATKKGGEYECSSTDVIKVLNLLAGIYLDQEMYQQTELLLKKALSLAEKETGEQSVDTAEALNNLGDLYENMEQATLAEEFFVRALSLYERHYGTEHEEIAVCYDHLGWLYDGTEEYDKATVFFQNALAMNEKLFHQNHTSVGISLRNLAMCYGNQEMYEQALPLMQRSWQIMTDDKDGGGELQTSEACVDLAIIYYEMDNEQQAEPIFLQALEVYEKYDYQNEQEQTLEVLDYLTELYQTWEDDEKACVYEIRADQLREKLED